MAFNFWKTFGGEFLKNAAKVADFVPGSELAKGIGTSIAIREASKFQEEATQRQKELESVFNRQLREAKSSGDQNKIDRLLKMSKEIGAPVNILEATLKDAPTNRQVLASGAELATLAALGYKPYLRTGKLATGKGIKGLQQIKEISKGIEIEEKIRKGKRGVKVLEKFIKPTLKEAAIGGALFATAEGARNRDATIDDLIKQGEKGGAIGGLTTAIVAATTGIAGRVARFVGPKAGAAFSRGIEKIERAALGADEIELLEKQLDKNLALIGGVRTLKQKTAQQLSGGIATVRKLRAGLLDRFSPLRRIEDSILSTTGRNLQENEKVYRDARLLSSVSDNKAETLVTGLQKQLDNYNDISDQSRAYLLQLDLIDRARLGQKVAGNQTLDDLVVGLKALQDEIGPQNLGRVGEVRRIVSGYNTKLLQDRVDAGLISREFMETLQRTHPNYIPHNVIMEADEMILKGIGSSLNVTKTDIQKAVGSVKNIDDPFAAIIQRTPITTRLIEKNKLLNNMVNVQEELSVIPGMVKLTEGATPSKGFESISLYKNGVKETWAVPEDIGIAIKNIDSPLTPAWFRMLTLPNRLLKAAATKFNLSFALPNKFRDKQTAALTADAFITDMAKRSGVTRKEVNLTSKEIQKLYKESGGFGASIFKDGEDIILKNWEKQGITKVMDAANPAKIINEINSSLETSTRLDVFEKALRSGLSPKDAAMVSRDATIDFAKMGTWLKPLNQAIPFLNARVQGFANIPKAIKNNPEAFARAQLYTAVYPAMQLHEHNRRFESYSNVSQYFKNKYWIIMTGEKDGVDSYTGAQIKVPQFLTIPKGEGQALVAGPIQYYLEKADKRDFRKTSEMIADTLGSASPLEFQGFDQSNFALTAISQLGPLASIPVGLGTNIHPFFGTPVVPESRVDAPIEKQFKSTTPEVTRELANIMGVPPAKLEFVFDSFGGLTQDIQDSIDIIYNVIRDGKLGKKSISDTPVGALTQIPISRRFIRESTEFGSPERQLRAEQKEDIEREVVGERLDINDKAEEIWREMGRRDTKDEKVNYLNSLGDELTDDIRKRIDYIKKTRQSVEVLRKSDSIEVRARYIKQRLDEMKDDGISHGDRVLYLDEMELAKILTKQVKIRIRDLSE